MPSANVHAVTRSFKTVFAWRLFWLLVVIAFSIFLTAHAPGQTIAKRLFPSITTTSTTAAGGPAGGYFAARP